MYDKGSVLRFETTLYQPSDFRVFRKPEGQPNARPRWMPMRQSLADLRRRAEVSQASNGRLMDAQAAVETPQTLQELTAKLGQPVTSPGRSKPDGTRSAARRFRALQLFAEKDLRLLTAVSRPEFNQNGFRNRDLRPLLFDAEPRDRHRRSSETPILGGFSPICFAPRSRFDPQSPPHAPLHSYRSRPPRDHRSARGTQRQRPGTRQARRVKSCRGNKTFGVNSITARLTVIC
jgi:hypothetical protein